MVPFYQSKPLTILIAADTYPPDINGAAVSTRRLALGMRDRGHDVHVVAARSSSGPSATASEDGVTVHRLRSHAAPTHASMRICLPWQIKGDIERIFQSISPDVAHVQCHYMVGKSVAEQAARHGTRLIATNHFMPENLDPFLPFPKWFLRIVAKNSWRDMDRVFGRADVITTPTAKSAETMYRHGFSRTVVPVSNGIAAEHYELAPDEHVARPHDPTILFVGRLAREKNINQLLDAFAQLPAELHARLEIVGVGELRAALELQAEQLGCGDRITFFGFATDAELRLAYLRSTLFVMPGTADLQSLVSLEAMAASKPLVLANALALPHLVEEGVNGYLFTPGDTQDLARKIERILRLPEDDRNIMGMASRAKVETHSFATTISTLEAIYRSQSKNEAALPHRLPASHP